MIERVLEAFFRHVLLIILPMVVIPLDVVAWVLSTPPQYEAQVGVWVERPTYLNFGADELTRYLPPATVQRNHLVELMRTRSFVSDVVSDTSLKPLLAEPAGAIALDQIFTRDLDVVQTGDHLLVIQFRAEDRELTLQVVSSMVEAFRARVSEDRRAQASLAIAFYKGRLNDTETTLSQARIDLSKYLATHPSVAQTLATSGIAIGQLDPGFADVQRRADAAKGDADGARSALQAAELDYSAGVQSDSLGFRIVDQAGASTTPSRQLKKVLAYPLIALIAGLVLSVSLLTLLTLSDHSVRSLSDLAPEMVLLGVLPRLRAQNLTRRPGRHVARRAIGFVAGATLLLRPSRRKAS